VSSEGGWDRLAVTFSGFLPGRAELVVLISACLSYHILPWRQLGDPGGAARRVTSPFGRMHEIGDTEMIQGVLLG
jgi:hypothetical protein